MNEETARRIGPDGIDIVYEQLGDPDGPPVLMLMGGGAQMINWPDGLCAALADRGLRLVRFDNRDSGRSTHITDGPRPDLAAAFAGDHSSASYDLSDMAADAVALLDHLEIPAAHLVGASLGGAIAQTIALEHPGRARSLTSMMSTTGDLAVGGMDAEALAGLGQPPADREGFIAWQVRALRAVASPRFRFDQEAVAARAALSYDRGHDPDGMPRQALASLASGDRTERLGSLSLPTLVVHGDADLMCDVSGGRATAAAIPGAKLLVVDGMGHHLAEEIWPLLSAEIALLACESGPAEAPAASARPGIDVPDHRGRTGLDQAGRDLNRNPRVVVREVELIASGWHVLRRTTYDYRRLDGSWAKEQRETYDRGDGATILLYDGDRRTVLLTRQFRFPVYVNDHPDGMFIEAAAGLLDADRPEAAIRREAAEELGVTVGPLTHAFDAFMSPGSVTERLYFYAAPYSPETITGSGGGVAAEGEEIEPLELDFDEALAMSSDGRITDAKTIMLLQWAALRGPFAPDA